MQGENFDEGFPTVDDEAGESQAESGKAKGEFKPNQFYSNDSVTRCDGFINEIKSHIPTGKTEPIYFVRAGVFQGSVLVNGEWVGDIENIDLLVGSTLKHWASKMQGHAELVKGVRHSFVIRNKRAVPDLYENKPVLRHKGILEVISIGSVD